MLCEAKEKLVIDINKCKACYNCQLACKDGHVGNDWIPYAEPQPDTGQFWMKVTDVVQGAVPKEPRWRCIIKRLNS